MKAVAIQVVLVLIISTLTTCLQLMEQPLLAPEAQEQETEPLAYPTIAESWGAIGWFILMSLVAGILAVPFFLHASPTRRMVTLITVSELSKVLALAFLLWKVPAVRRVRLRLLASRELPIVYMLLPVLVLAQLVLRTLVVFLPLPTWMNKTLTELHQWPVLSFVVVCVTAPILEELFFRGLLLSGLLKNYSPRKAIMQSSLLFGLIHLYPMQAVSAMVMGLFLGWLYYRTQSLIACIVAHALNNTVAWVLMQQTSDQWGESRKEMIQQLPEPLRLTLLMLAAAVLFVIAFRRIQQATEPITLAQPNL
jgi:membrane protease YdiL (CAAX protease family)